MTAKKEAAPCDAASSGERRTNSTASADAQPPLELTKLFLRCGPRARREFVADIGAEITRKEGDQ